MVFTITIIIVALFAIWGAVAPDQLADVANVAYNFSIQNFGWFYLLATLFFLIFAFYLAFSRFGGIRLGDDDDEPEYSTISWLSMLFSAGMGIGLVFWGVAEPLSHYLSAPEGRYPKQRKQPYFQCVIPFSTGGCILGLSIPSSA